MELNGFDMRKIIVFILSVILTGCSNILPGMQSMNIDCMRKMEVPATIRPCPVVIPITASLLCDCPPENYVYRVEPQDVLSILVWQHPEFSPPVQQMATSSTSITQSAGQAGYLVDHSGYIFFPLVGKIYVAGKTVEQIRVSLTSRLEEYVRSPQIIIRVADFRSKKVYILGEVMKPGLFPLNDQPMSITDAITLAGSFDVNSADTRHVYVIRGCFTTPRIYWLDAKTPDVLLLAEKFQLQPDDIVYVSTAAVTRWNRFLNQLLPTLQTIIYTKATLPNRL